LLSLDGERPGEEAESEDDAERGAYDRQAAIPVWGFITAPPIFRQTPTLRNSIRSRCRNATRRTRRSPRSRVAPGSSIH